MPGTVGFVGLGAMGGPMAQNLVKHGSAVAKVLERHAGVTAGKGAK